MCCLFQIYFIICILTQRLITTTMLILFNLKPDRLFRKSFIFQQKHFHLFQMFLLVQNFLRGCAHVPSCRRDVDTFAGLHLCHFIAKTQIQSDRIWSDISARLWTNGCEKCIITIKFVCLYINGMEKALFILTWNFACL